MQMIVIAVITLCDTANREIPTNLVDILLRYIVVKKIYWYLCGCCVVFR